MKIKIIVGLIFSLLLWSSSFSQKDRVEEFREKGYEFRVAENYDSAIFYYEKVYNLGKYGDDDASWELSNLYLKKGNYKKSLFYNEEVLFDDELGRVKDLLLLERNGDLYLKLDKTKEAIKSYEIAINYFYTEIKLYYKLAKAYSWNGEIKEAINTYEDIIEMDSTLSEAWAGIAKMKYWSEKPHTASWYYQKALELDPTNEEILAEYEIVKNELNYKLSINVRKVNETENSYTIDAIIQKYTFENRILDKINISVNALYDYSDRKFTSTDTIGSTRWFDNYWATVSWIENHHRISLFGGYSYGDSKITNYGLNYKTDFDISKFKIINSITARYNYFYYWNKVGSKSISDNISINYKKFKLRGGAEFGVIDSVELWDYYNKKYDVGESNYYSYNFGLGYQITDKPKITVSANYSLMDFQYKSLLYYSPYERVLKGISTSIYHKMGKFYIYAGGSYNVGTEVQYEEIETDVFQKEKLDVTNWNADFEFGYNFKPFTFIVNGSKFYNPYYTNYVVGFTIKAEL